MKLHNELNIISNTQTDDMKEIDKQTEASSNLQLEIKKKNKKINSNLESFLKVPTLTNKNENKPVENGISKNIKAVTTDSGNTKMLADLSTIVDKTTTNHKQSFSSKSPTPTNTNNVKAFNIKAEKQQQHNLKTNDSTFILQKRDITPKGKNKDNSKDTYLDRYRTKKVISDCETLKENALMKNVRNAKIDKGNDMSDRIPTENNISTLEKDKSKKVQVYEKKVSQMDSYPKKQNNVVQTPKIEIARPFTDVFSVLKTSFEENKHTGAVFAIRFNNVKGKKTSSVGKTKEKVIELK